MLTIEDLKKDIAAFALARTAVESKLLADGAVRLTWTDRARQSRAAEFTPSSDGTNWMVLSGGLEQPYADFLTSDRMADLDALAQRVLDCVQRQGDHLEVRISVELDEEISTPEASGGLDVLIEETLRLAHAESGQTQVIFVRGPAGAGKSVMLREMCRRLAERWLAGDRSVPLGLYVDAQAKALLSLEDAFSAVLDEIDVRAIRKDAVGVLCRSGLIIPCVDGFDELLGAGGFGEAFNSLGAFLSRLGGSGTILASGRSTFYDQEQLHSAAQRYVDSDFRTTTVTVHPWNADEVRQYCASVWEDSEDKGRFVTALNALLRSEHLARLLGKPFFACEVAQLMPSVDFRDDEPLMRQLVGGLLDREAPKWVDRNKQLVLTVEQHESLLAEVAAEMWWAGRQELDVETVRVLAELISTDAPIEHRTIVMNKAPLHGAFESGTDARSTVRFQHPIYLDYFLSQRLIAVLRAEDHSAALGFLERGVLGESVLDVVHQLSAKWSAADVSRMISILGACLKPDGRYHAARLNAGAIAATLIDSREQEVQRARFRLMYFQRVEMRDALLQECAFEACSFEEVRLYGLRLSNCTFQSCTMRRAFVSDTTRFDCSLDGCAVQSMTDPDTGTFVSAPGSVASILARLGARQPTLPPPPAPTPIQQERRLVLERLLRKLDRQHYFGGDLEMVWGLTGFACWPDLRRALVDLGVAVRRTIPKRGPDGTLLALNFTSQQVRDGESLVPTTPTAIRAFWDYMNS